MIKQLVGHAPAVALVVLSIFVFGVVSYLSLPRESSPDIKIPYVMVTTPYMGVSPEDIESLVTIPIENELAGIKDLAKMTSTSAEGLSLIVLEFEPEVVIEDALQRVRDRVNRAGSSLPEDTEDSSIREISMSDWPIMIVTIAGHADQEQLQGYAESLEDDILRISGVLDTRVSGGLTREIRVQVDPRRLAVYGLSLNDIIGAVGNENVNIPGGAVVTGDGSFLVRVPGEFSEARQVEQVAVKRVGGKPVFVRDLGRVVDGFEDATSYARMNGQPAVSLAITKRAGANIIDIGDEVKRLVKEQSQGWADGVSYRILSDRSDMIRDMVTELENNIITALLLVVVVIFFFMGIRNSLFIGLAIPLSMLMSFAVIEALGFTLNMIVLFSLILALGMLVDNGIVIVENIYRHAETGKGPWQASIDGTGEVAMAVAASTATTVVAFLPLVFWTGIMGEFMGYLPKTVIIVLLSSLVVALGVLPVITSRFLKRSGITRKDVMETDSRVMLAYRRLLRAAIEHRYLAAGLGLATLLSTIVAYAFLNHGTEFFPNVDPSRATITIRMADGTDLDATDAVVRKVESVLARLENVDVYVAETGVSGGGLSGSQNAENQARITVDFLPTRNDAARGDKSRVESTVVTIDKIRAAVASIPGAEINVEKERMGPPVGDAISVQVAGDDFHQVGALASLIMEDMRSVDGVTDLSHDYRVGRPEMRLRVDRGAARRIGVSTAVVANTVRTALSGTKASTLHDGKDEYDITVELDPRFRDDLPSVISLRLPGRLDKSPKTFQVPLSAVASYGLAGGSGAIHHVDRELVVTIGGDVAEGYNENAVRSNVEALLARFRASGRLSDGYTLDLGGADDKQREAQAFLSRAFGYAIALIAFVLVAQFNSFRLPLIIMATVVLSLVGVLWGLIFTGTSFGVIMTGIGVISLAGVVVNNGIVLLDYVEKLRARGHDLQDALVRGGMTRFRPVMLTAVTTILGLVPMATGVSFDFEQGRLLTGGDSAQFWGPMAVAVIFGLAFATVLTLVLVPVMYLVLEDARKLWDKFLSRSGKRGERVLLVAAKGIVLLFVALAPRQASAAPVSLEQAWEAAQQNNLDLAISAESTVQVETLRGQALSLLSPKLSVSGSYTLNQYEISFDPSEMFSTSDELASILGDIDLGDPIIIQQKTALGANFSVVQPILNASALPLLRGAYRSVDAARHDQDSTRVRLRSTLAHAYYGLAVAIESRKLAAQAVETAQHGLELVERQVDAGLQPPRALVQAKLSVAQARRELGKAEESLAQADETFVRMTGLERGSEPLLPPSPEPPSSLDQALSEARSRRPDLMAAAERVRAARCSLVAKKLEWLPTVDGVFSYTYTDNTGFLGENTFWMLIFEANWNFWDGGLRLAQARQEASKQRQARLVAQQQTQLAQEQVRNAWERVQRSRSAVDAAQQQVALARENLELATRALSAGSGTWLEVDQARLALLQAQMAALAERMERDLDIVDLRVAMGSY